MSTKSTLSLEQQARISAFLNSRELPSGLGTEKASCSIASINLALTGRLTDDIPDCMSLVIGTWIIHVQDAMPAAMRNSPEWKQLLPRAAGTGRELELKREKLILDWMWAVTLPQVQPVADELGFGDSWREMCQRRTGGAARAASESGAASAARIVCAKAQRAQRCKHWAAASAAASADHAAAHAASAAYADRAAAQSVRAAGAAAAAYWRADAVNAAVLAAIRCARSVSAGVQAGGSVGTADAVAAYWHAIDPCALLAKLIEVSR